MIVDESESKDDRGDRERNFLLREESNTGASMDVGNPLYQSEMGFPFGSRWSIRTRSVSKATAARFLARASGEYNRRCCRGVSNS